MANREVDSLKATRRPIKSKLTRFKNFLEKIKNKTQGLTTLAEKLEKFDPIYAEFDSVQTQIEILLEKDKEALAEQTRQREEFEDEYFLALSEARTILEQSRTTPVPDRQTSNPVPGTSSGSQSSVTSPLDISQFLQASALAPNLPKITIRHFDGSFNDWVKFRDTFKTLVHDRARISNIEKFHYLSTLEKAQNGPLDSFTLNWRP